MGDALGYLGRDLVREFLGVQVIGFHRDRGKALIEPSALVQHRAQAAARVAGHNDAGPVKPDPPGDRAEGGGEVDHGQALEHVLNPIVEHRTAAEGKDPAVLAKRAARTKRASRRRALKIAEVLLAILDEDVGS